MSRPWSSAPPAFHTLVLAWFKEMRACSPPARGNCSRNGRARSGRHATQVIQERHCSFVWLELRLELLQRLVQSTGKKQWHEWITLLATVGLLNMVGLATVVYPHIPRRRPAPSNMCVHVSTLMCTRATHMCVHVNTHMYAHPEHTQECSSENKHVFSWNAYTCPIGTHMRVHVEHTCVYT